MTNLKALVKFKLSMMVLMSSMLSYFVVAGSMFSWFNFIMLTIGGFLVTGSANALNQVLERDFDKLMDRTKERPLPSGQMTVSEAVLIGGIFAAVGITCLSLINPICAFLGTLSLIIYAFVYTPMKRYSTASVAIGAIPGALPVLIGTVAGEGYISAFGLALFMIQFLWQFPHFWAIGWLSFADYKKAGYKLLPINKEGNIDENLGFYSAIYAFFLIPTCISIYLIDVRVSMVACILSVILAMVYLYFCIAFQQKSERKTAMRLMFSSFFYLPLILATYLIF